MSRHTTDSAVHPECATFDSTIDLCNCDSLHGFSNAGLDRAIEVAERMDFRRTNAVRGYGPDADEATLEYARQNAGPASAPVDNHGFWKESQNLKCRRGDRMVSDDRGLPPGYMDERKQS